VRVIPLVSGCCRISVNGSGSLAVFRCSIFPASLADRAGLSGWLRRNLVEGGVQSGLGACCGTCVGAQSHGIKVRMACRPLEGHWRTLLVMSGWGWANGLEMSPSGEVDSCTPMLCIFNLVYLACNGLAGDRSSLQLAGIALRWRVRC